jgi:hypothetical protein
MRPLFETVFAAFLLGAALFLLLFGPDGAVMLAYQKFPVDQRMWLYESFPPSRVHIDLPYQVLAAGVVLLFGALRTIGVWVVVLRVAQGDGGPEHRVGGLGSVAVFAGEVLLNEEGMGSGNADGVVLARRAPTGGRRRAANRDRAALPGPEFRRQENRGGSAAEGRAGD